MIRKINKWLILSFLAIAITSGISAKSRLIFGLGIQFDPNSLGGTFVKDGLESGVGKYDSAGNYQGQQSILLAENELQVLENLSGGVFSLKSDGPMTAGSITFGYESDLSFYKDVPNFFYRIGMNLSTVVSGGHKSASFLGYKYYDERWFYRSVVIPAYLGIKMDVGGTPDKPAFGFYMAPGLHYYKAMWQLKGTVDGTGLHAATNGLTRSLPATGSLMDPSAINEDARFDGSGIGFSFLTGVQARITDNGFAFIEMEYHGSYDMGTAGTKSTGGMAGLSPYPAYPVTVGGTVYRFGYKHEL